MLDLPPLSSAASNFLLSFLSVCNFVYEYIIPVYLKLRTQVLRQLKPDNVSVYVGSTDSI